MSDRSRNAGKAVLVLLIGIGIGYVLRHHPGGSVQAPQGLPKVGVGIVEAEGGLDARSDQDGRRNAIVRAIEATNPAVVSISVTLVEEYYVSLDPFWESFFPELRQRVREPVSRIGSGVIVTRQGHILTNEHVIEKAKARKIVVNLQDGRQFEVKNIERDVHSVPELDIAVLRIDGDGLPFARLGNSDEAIIGEWAIAIGCPFGLFIREHPSVTVGVISATHRDFRTQQAKVYRDMIQTDASINQGNSGGPLVIASGEVIGINTFIISSDRGGGSVGIGFALPINKARKVLDEVTLHGKIRDAWSGISIHEVNASLAQYFDLPRAEGVIITDVKKGSPGDKAGLKPGDLIMKIDGKVVQNAEETTAAFAGASVGDVYRLTVVREGKEREMKLRLEEK